MARHDTAFVPVESWSYASPDVRLSGSTVDAGLFCESLIYYDRVLLNFGNQSQFAEFLKWLNVTNELRTFLNLVSEGVVRLADLSFLTSAIEKDGVYSIWNLQDEVQAREGTFDQRVLYHRHVHVAIPNNRERSRVYDVLRGTAIELKSEQFGPAIESARVDLADARRAGLVIQAFIDELFEAKSLGRPPEVSANVRQDSSGLIQTNYSVDLEKLSTLAGPLLNFHRATPITGAANAAKFLWAAALNSCDLYAPSPLSTLVGDKLYETVSTPVKVQQVMTGLKETVEFPDVRQLVNSGQLRLSEVLVIRDKASRFRQWLQEEGERDRDAIIAYHNEVARDSGLTRHGRKALSLFGLFGGSAVGGAIGGAIAGAPGGALGAVAGTAIGYSAELVAKLGAGWRPVVFGKWTEDRIARFMRERR